MNPASLPKDQPLLPPEGQGILPLSGHRLAEVPWLESPNQNARPDPMDVSLLVIHGISLPPGHFGGGHVQELFSNTLNPAQHPVFVELAQVRVSAHVLVERSGALTQFVRFDRRAWHAGESRWAGRDNCNNFAIGIELEGTDALAYSDRQYQALAVVCRSLVAAYPGLHPDTIVGHSDIAPGRKTDPGPAFDWPRLHRAVANAPV